MTSKWLYPTIKPPTQRHPHCIWQILWIAAMRLRLAAEIMWLAHDGPRIWRPTVPKV